jgi:hypothetical protein
LHERVELGVPALLLDLLVDAVSDFQPPLSIAENDRVSASRKALSTATQHITFE